jgi:polyisoprenoid-binding protein YceI
MRPSGFLLAIGVGYAATLVAVAPSASAQSSYLLDQSASLVTFRGRALFQPIAGRSEKLAGAVTIVGRDISSVRGVVRFAVTSLDVEPDVRASEIQQMFGGARSAEIIFRVDSIERPDTTHVVLRGRLTMNGVTRTIAFTGAARIGAESRIEARGETQVDLRKWNIRPPRRFAGLVGMHHELTLSFRAEFERPAPAARAADIAAGGTGRGGLHRR